VSEAIEVARQHDLIVALGIEPTRPETGYGYLKVGGPFEGSAIRLEKFIEKPALAKAQELLREGGYLWNGGMYATRVSTLLREFDIYMPEMKKIWEQCKGQVARAYPRLTATSVDYGVMEKTRAICAIKLVCGWDDLGSWTAMENLEGVKKDPSGIVLAGNVGSLDAQRNIVDAPNKFVGLLGVNDLIVVQHGDAILIASKDRAQDVKQIVEKARQHGKG
jgi:mannose-1-phosphate guanylyltransferase